MPTTAWSELPGGEQLSLTLSDDEWTVASIQRYHSALMSELAIPYRFYVPHLEIFGPPAPLLRGRSLLRSMPDADDR